MRHPARSAVSALRTFALTALLGSSLAMAAALPYDETADAKADVQQALTAAKAAKLPVLLVFGANWCEDCRALDTALKSPENAALMAKEFKVVKVDVGNFNHNLDLAQRYGNPIKKGIPAAVIVAADTDQVLYATRGGELANARRMSATGVHDFFAKATQEAQGKPATP